MEEPRYSLSEVAAILGLTVQAFRKKLAIKALLQSDDYVIGPRGAKLYRLSDYPPDIQTAILHHEQQKNSNGLETSQFYKPPSLGVCSSNDPRHNRSRSTEDAWDGSDSGRSGLSPGTVWSDIGSGVFSGKVLSCNSTDFLSSKLGHSEQGGGKLQPLLPIQGELLGRTATSPHGDSHDLSSMGSTVELDAPDLKTVGNLQPVYGRDLNADGVGGANRKGDVKQGITLNPKATAKIALTAHFQQWKAECIASGRKAKCCVAEYTTLYNSQQLENVPEECYQHWPTLPHEATLATWFNLAKTEGDLNDKRGKNREGKGIIQSDSKIKALVDGAIKNLGPSASSTTLRKLPEIAELDLKHGTVSRYLQDLKTKHRPYWLKLTNPKAYRNSAEPKFGRRSYTDLLPNSVWELDFTRNDLILQLEDGRQQRFAIGGLIDVATRRRLFILSTAPRGVATVELLIKAVLTWGIPQIVRPDNGKEFLNDRVRGFCNLLEIILDPCTPGKPQEKPHIERLFGTLNHDKIPLLPSYVGHNVATRTAIREAKTEKVLHELAMQWTDFEQWLDAWRIESENEFHSGLGLTPNEKLQEYINDGWQPTPCPHTLHFLRNFAHERKEVTINSYGINHQRRRYIAVELAPYIGQKLNILIDWQDPRHLWVLAPGDKEILCEAKWEVTLTDQQMMTIAQQAKQAVRGINEQSTAAGKIARRMTKSLEQDPLALFNQKTRDQAAALQATTEATTQTLSDAADGKLLPPNADPEKVVSFPVRAVPKPVSICDPMFSFDPDHTAAEVLQPEPQGETLTDLIERLAFRTPFDQWKPEEVAFVKEEHLDLLKDLLELSPDVPGAPGVLQWVNQTYQAQKFA